ncbi:hypothetical protein, partial [Niveispirillum sp. KHB5.9]|uniref:hypothetical protein n=1 Tax=Niveispirillum sp. KHB5.9 TaxID=3400269 RepID=UPI003A85079D
MGIDPTGLMDVAANCKGKPTCNVSITQTVDIVHQRNGKTVVESTVLVKMNFTLTENENGDVSASVSATVENLLGREISATHRSTMGNIVETIQKEAIGRSFGENTTQMVTAIGMAESRLGTSAAPPKTPAFKAPDINPMQLSSGRANLE